MRYERLKCHYLKKKKKSDEQNYADGCTNKQKKKKKYVYVKKTSVQRLKTLQNIRHTAINQM